jgi:predicted phosphodiesterase
MAQAKKDTRIGVIADTHSLFDPAIRRHFKGVDHILHAGDRREEERVAVLGSMLIDRRACLQKARRSSAHE